MTNWIFFIISTLAVVSCRPQINTQDAPSPTVEVEKQELFEISTRDLTRKQLEENTKEILKKIALVNEKQGLNKKKPRPHYQHFPFSYLRSQKTDEDFKFPRDPFTNPILEYIEKGTNQRSSVTGHLNVLDKVEEENEAPPGQYIKRKIIHQQTMVVPSNLQQPQYLYNQNELEKQTVNNIKNIVENSHYTMGYNPFSVPYNYYQNQPDPYQFYNPYVSQQMTRQQWQWPLAQYFPIVIKDPLVHFFNAMTTMVEYGPNAGQADSSCSKKPHKDDKKAREVEGPRKLSYSIVNNDQGAEITVSNDDSTNSTTVVEIEDLEITDNTPQNRKSKQNQEINKTFFYNITKSAGEALNSPRIQTLQITSNDTSRQSPPIRDQILDDDELEMDEVEKAEDVQVSHDGNKKLFSKDNTGSGIFVHKIKVRKGGVAIAGPGGIATAGSGGTAIVGPHGWAYTHPDSLAIAGSGTKVVAVEPTINLAQVINEHHENKNRTRGQNKTPSRFGKVVAVGPVIYYNKGFIIFPNGRWPSQPTLSRTYPSSAFLPSLSQRQEINNSFQEETPTHSLAPYSNHPLFHYLKNRNTINTDRIISFRNGDNDKNVTTLILKPMAKAVAGIDGQAISNPLSRAILRRGMNVDILFEPDAVAIAGPGGVAHAQSDLEIAYEDSVDSYKWEKEEPKVTLVPYYGGALGQSLQIIEMPDGTTFTSIVKTPPKRPEPNEEIEITVTDLENPPLPTKQDIDFGSNIRNIHRTAINIIRLQELAKKNGKLNEEEESVYQKNMEELNASAKNLAELQEPEDGFSFENREGLTEWFERKKANKKEKDKKKKEEEEEEKKKEEEEDKKRKEESKKKEKPKEEEEEEEGEEENEDTDGISVGLPPADASVAEAKPVGLAVAGEGGVAASKPIATAVVGPGGLAIARPVGTAIAGVAPDQALVPIYAEGYVGGTKPKRYGTNNKADAASEFLNKIISKYHQA